MRSAKLPKLLIAAVVVLGLSVVLQAALPASDTFTGTGALSGNWTSQTGNPDRASDLLHDSAAAESKAMWTADAFNDDQYALLKPISGLSGVSVRSTGTVSAYSAYTLIGTPGGTPALHRWSSNTATDITPGGLANFPASGHVVELRATGQATVTLAIYYDSVHQVDQTDSSGSRKLSGSAGVFVYNGATADDFEGGNIGGSPGTTHHGITTLGIGMLLVRPQW